MELYLRLTPKTHGALARLAAREGIPIESLIDRWLSMALLVADEADRGRFLMTAAPPVERATVFRGVGSELSDERLAALGGTA